MNTPLRLAWRKAGTLLFLIFIIISSCQKEDPITGLSPIGIRQGSLLGESKTYFQREVLAQAPMSNDGNLRHQVSKTPLWDQAVAVQLSIGPALKVPIAYQQPVFIQVGPSKQAIALSELSYLLLYKDRQGLQHAEVVTCIPDQLHQLNFSGIILVEDWWGRPIQTIQKTADLHYLKLGSPVLSQSPKIEEPANNAAEAEQDCDVIVTEDERHMYNVEYICHEHPGGGGNGGGWDFPHGGWGNGGGQGPGPGDYGDQEPPHPHGGGGGGPQPPDYEERPRGGGGGGRRNENPPTPEDRPEINTPEEFLAEIDDSGLSPCFTAILSDIKVLSNGSIAGIIQKFAGHYPGYNWKLMDGLLPQNQNAATSTNYDRITGKVTTKFDLRKFENATDLSIARTIIHESVHAFLIAELNIDPILAQTITYPELWQRLLNNNDPEGIYHEEMTKNYIDDIALALAEYGEHKGFNYSFQFYQNLSWGGLTHDKYGNLMPIFLQSVPSEIERDQIINTILIEQNSVDQNGNITNPQGHKVQCIN